MQTYLDCYACFLNQALRTARMATDDVDVHKRILDRVSGRLASFPLSANPPEMAVFIYQTVRELCGNSDPYAAVKRDYNRRMLTRYAQLKERVRRDSDPLRAAVSYAIAGNVIDFGSSSDFDLDAVLDGCQETACTRFDFDTFRSAVASADHILYLGDNAGEIVLDKLLIETLARPTVFVVRDAPIINDVTRSDADAVSMGDVAEVISNGDGAPGTILARCAPGFRARFDAAPMIISKGQGNFETLSAEDRPIFFLLRVKCRVVARHLNIPAGVAVLMASDAAKRKYGEGAGRA